jgi:hypothetical protein
MSRKEKVYRRRGAGLNIRFSPYAITIFVLTGIAAVTFPSINKTAAETNTQINIPGPAGSGRFGEEIFALPNGNIVVTDPSYDIPGGAANAGAVYLYNGGTGALISTLTGSQPNDAVGSPSTSTGIFIEPGIKVLSNGNFIVKSPSWRNGSAQGAGAITLVNGTTGLSGIVSESNSLVGSSTLDLVGFRTQVLPNGNYLVVTPGWDNGSILEAGAVTFASGTSGAVGVISSANSLIGSLKDDAVGGGLVTVLSNGNYVVNSPKWTNQGAGIENRAKGAVTFGSGTSGVSGVVSAANSLVGSALGNEVGRSVALSNGNYVVPSPYWDNGAIEDVGAVTFGDGTMGTSGMISPANSLIGVKEGDLIGVNGVVRLTTGNYVVVSPNWATGQPNGQVHGAVTFGNGTLGTTGTVSAANSLVGSAVGDRVGSNGVVALSTGNYVVSSPDWNGGSFNGRGAATFGDGTVGIAGTISAANSLIGSAANDRVGSSGIIALTNGNYVVNSETWNGTAGDVGASTFGNGTSGITGVVTAANSLVGSTAGDNVGYIATALSNGNYVVGSPKWDRAGIVDAGASTFVNGITGISGPVSLSNSLVGSTASDQVGGTFRSFLGGGRESLVTLLTNGNYLIRTPLWNKGSIADAGAVTFANGSTGIAGEISAANSLVGSTANDQIGFFRSGGDGVIARTILALPNGDYAVGSPNFDNGNLVNAGAVTYADGNNGTVGTLSAGASYLGTTANGFVGMNYVFDAFNNKLVIARPNENIVTVFQPKITPPATPSPSPTPQGGSIAGSVSYGTTPAGSPQRFVPGVILTAAGSVPRTATTAASGLYSLTGLGSGAYTVTPSKSSDVNGSISGLDAARVAQQVAGLISLSPNQQIAGDATNNGSLSGLDAARIAQTVAGLPNVGIAGQWKFVPVSRTYPSTLNSFADQNYVAVLVGDVTGNWTPSAAGERRESPASFDKQEAGLLVGATATRTASVPGPVPVTLPESIAATGKIVVPIVIGDMTGRGIVAYDFTLDYDPNALTTDMPASWSAGTTSDGCSIVVNTEIPGRITVSAFSTSELAGSGTLLNLNFKPIGGGRGGTHLKWPMFQLNEGQVPAYFSRERE